MKESKYKQINTTWVASAAQGTGSLQYTTVDSSTGQAQGAATNFSIKGICYSPAPIGESNKNGPEYWRLVLGLIYSGGWNNYLELVALLGNKFE